MSLAQRKLAQVTLGETYPYPVIDPEKLSEAAAATRRAVRVVVMQLWHVGTQPITGIEFG